ncbi:hypothetical protein [Tepidibacter mesophilus]|uniref:hypothetical protein n=1 Tax=Tepidibacter mesophilus TaxID=655607 RepID=UPI000C067EE4|nr:hypothetical protein [Tepidibacter mesophilus]
MSNNDYLSEEEQFKEILNNEEISRIKDPELRSIRLKYWNLLHQTFLDERKIPDGMLGKEFDNIKATEIKELEEYREHKNKG